MKKLLKKRKNAKRGQTRTAFQRMAGAVWSYEVTNIGNGWHPHLHGIGLVPKGTDPKRMEVILKKEWEKITGDSHQLRVEFPNSREDQEKAFFEVFKYSLKMSDLSIHNQVVAYLELSGRRLMASFGSFYGCKVPDDEIQEDKLREFYDIVYRFDGKKYGIAKYEYHAPSTIREEESAHERQSRISAKKKLDLGNRELKWKAKMKQYVRLNNSKISSGNMLTETTIESVQFVKEVLEIGEKITFRPLSRLVEPVGKNSDMEKRRIKKWKKTQRKQLSLLTDLT